MTDTTNVAGGRQSLSRPNAYNPLVSGSFPVGTPVAQSLSQAGVVVPGQADTNETAFVTGIAVVPAVDGERALVQFAGPLTLTTAEWDAITGGSGGLTLGPYYLDAASAGKLTTTSPSFDGTFVVQVGIATSPTDFIIQLGGIVQNSP